MLYLVKIHVSNKHAFLKKITFWSFVFQSAHLYRNVNDKSPHNPEECIIPTRLILIVTLK